MGDEARGLMGVAVQSVRTGARIPVGGGRKHAVRSPIDKAKAYEVVWDQVSGLFDAARLYRDCSFIYVIGEEDEGHVKIGLSKDPIARLRNMQTGNPRRLRIEHVLIGTMPTEKLLHELWEPFAVLSSRSAGKPGSAPGTEWFKPEARETLLPIVEAAVAQQIERLLEFADVTPEEMDRIVRDAHAESGFVAQGRDEVVLLASGPGYVVARPSRL